MASGHLSNTSLHDFDEYDLRANELSALIPQLSGFEMWPFPSYSQTYCI